MYISELGTSDKVTVSDKQKDNPSREITENYLSKMLSYAIRSQGVHSLAHELTMTFGSLDNMLSAEYSELENRVGEMAAVLIKLLAYTSSRRVSDAFRFGRRHTDYDIVDMLVAKYIGSSVETVYMVSLDEAERVVACDFIVEGTANASDICQRKIVECVLRRGAKSVIIAHNHPSGSSAASSDDILATAVIHSLLRSVGVQLKMHVIVSSRDYRVLKLDPQTGVVRDIGHI